MKIRIVASAIVLGLVLGVPVVVSAWNFKPEQAQSQRQGQIQSQGQGQVNDQTLAPSQSVRTETTFDRYAPTVVAPALTSGGIGICLGSFAFGLSGPMAGVSFGKTTEDAGCARARDSMILHNMGLKGAALRVLSGSSIKEALEAEGLMPQPKAAAVVVEPAPVVLTVPAAVIFADGGH